MTEFYKFLQLYTPHIVVPISLLGVLLVAVSKIYTLILLNYLNKNRPVRRKELDEINFLGPMLNGKDILIRYRYVFGALDDDYQKTLRLKIKIRNFLKLGLSLFLGVPMFFALLFLICVLRGQR